MYFFFLEAANEDEGKWSRSLSLSLSPSLSSVSEPLKAPTTEAHKPIGSLCLCEFNELFCHLQPIEMKVIVYPWLGYCYIFLVYFLAFSPTVLQTPSSFAIINQLWA